MPPPLLFDLRAKRVYVAGHRGLAGSAIARRLASEGCEVLTADHAVLDLTKQEPTENWVMQTRPERNIPGCGPRRGDPCKRYLSR